MKKSHGLSESGDDPSSSSVNLEFLEAWKKSRPRPKTKLFEELLESLSDPALVEAIWIFYGERSLDFIDEPVAYLNKDIHWWQVWRRERTVRTLASTIDGKKRVWMMLHDLSAWQ
jgi:hypothetical protein